MFGSDVEPICNYGCTRNGLRLPGNVVEYNSVFLANTINNKSVQPNHICVGGTYGIGRERGKGVGRCHATMSILINLLIIIIIIII